MNAGAGRGLDPEIADRVANLSLSAHKIVDGVLSGIHRSPHRGASVVFAEHREYRPGDDLRQLDWKVYARSDRYAIKRFEQETHLRATLVLDVSASMDYGEGREHKATYAATLLSALALVLLRQGDAVGACTVDGSVLSHVPPRTRPDHFDALLTVLGRRPRAASNTDLYNALGEVAERSGRRGVVVVASDLLDAQERALEPLAHLSALGHEAFVFHVLHHDELELPFADSATFAGLESDERLDADPVRLRAAYRDEIGKFVEHCRARCTALGVRYTLTPTDRPIEEVLATALSQRGARRWG